MERYFSLQSNKCAAPSEAVWIDALQAMIEEDGDRMEVFRSDIGCNWLYAVRITTAYHNFTDDVKKDLVPSMCDPAMNLGPCWQEISAQTFRNLKEEIIKAKEAEVQKWKTYQENYEALSRLSRNDGYYSEGIGRSSVSGCNHAAGWCHCR